MTGPADESPCDGGEIWTVERSRELAATLLSPLGDRWLHVQAAGRRAEELRDRGLIEDDLVSAAWLHDIGYAPELAVTDFHPLDGAVYLRRLGAPDRVVALVASHTGAAREADERGLNETWSALPVPDAESLDVLTLVDLVTSPTGDTVDPTNRIDDILGRYDEHDPVHRAVKRSGPTLLTSAQRARLRLGLSDVWPGVPVEGVL